MEVPLAHVVPSPIHRLKIASPGAAMSIQSPWVDQLDKRSPMSVDATAIISSKYAG